MKYLKVILVAFLGVAGLFDTKAGTVTLVGNGAGGGPIIVTSSLGSLTLGTRLRVGTFNDLTLLNSTISSFLTGTSFATTLAALNSNFSDIGTNVTNYGNAVQTGTGVSSSQVVFNTTASLSINGATAANYSVFNGNISNVNYSSSIGASKNLYIWTAFNNEIGIFRNADGTGTTSWVTPTSDLSGVTLNLSGLQATAGGSMQNAEVLLGTVYDYGSGSDLVALIPEPSTGSLMMIATVGLVALRRLRKV